MSTKRSEERFPEHGNGPHEPGDKSNKFSDTKNIGGEPESEHHDKQGRDHSSFGPDDGRRLVKKRK